MKTRSDTKTKDKHIQTQTKPLLEASRMAKRCRFSVETATCSGLMVTGT